MEEQLRHDADGHVVTPSGHRVQSHAKAAATPLRLLALSTALLVLACVDTTGPPFPLIEATEFDPSLGVDLSLMTRTGGGVYLRDREIGAGTVLRPPHFVTISYSLHLADGQLIEQRDSVSFRMGCRHTVPGLEAGILDMRVDGRRQVVVPGRLGYGTSPPPGSGVPIGAILVYEVTAESSWLVEERQCVSTGS